MNYKRKYKINWSVLFGWFVLFGITIFCLLTLKHINETAIQNLIEEGYTKQQAEELVYYE